MAKTKSEETQETSPKEEGAKKTTVKKTNTKKVATQKTSAKKTSSADASDSKKAVKKSVTKANASKDPGLKVPQGAFYATGRRKSSVARVWIFSGTGQCTVNNKKPEAYFKRDLLVDTLNKPLIKLSLSSKFDIKATVTGGGLAGQADALQLGISRALLLTNPEFKPSLKESKLLTRDMRIKERKKYGRKKARKGRTYRKR